MKSGVRIHPGTLFLKMHVYILQSSKNGRYYIGCTKNIERRISEHKKGYEQSTKGMLPVELVFQKEFETLSDARKVESKLKKLKRRDYIEKIIKSGEITI